MQTQLSYRHDGRQTDRQTAFQLYIVDKVTIVIYSPTVNIANDSQTYEVINQLQV